MSLGRDNLQWLLPILSLEENISYKATYPVPYICNALTLPGPENPQMFNLLLCKNPYLSDLCLASVIELLAV